MPVGEKKLFRFGPFQLDLECGEVRKEGVPLKLKGQPVEILGILLEKPGQLVPRDELRRRLWPSDTFVDFDHSLNTAVKKLRKELGDDAATPLYIETLPRHGYRFVGELVREHTTARTLSDWPANNEGTATPITSTRVDEKFEGLHWVRRKMRWVGGLLATMAVVAGAWYWMTRPVPMPTVVRTHRLTNSTYSKGANIAVDGNALYFNEGRTPSIAIVRIPFDGGEPTVVSNAVGYLADVSADRSYLITAAPSPERALTADLWMVPLPTGTPRFIIGNANWTASTGDSRGVFFSRNSDTELYRVNIDGSDLRLIAKVPDITGLHRSPDGLRLRFTVLPRFELWEVDSDGSHTRTIFERQMTYGGGWSPDGKYYFYAKAEPEGDNLWVVRDSKPIWRKGGEPRRLTSGPMTFSAPRLSLDGRQIFTRVIDRRGELSVYEEHSRGFVPYLAGISACLADFSRDGQWIAYISYPEGTLWRSRIDGSDKKQLTSPGLAAFLPRWSPDGKFIVFTDNREGLATNSGSNGDSPNRIYLVSSEGGAPMLLAVGRGVHDPMWSKDGKSIVYGRAIWVGATLTMAEGEIRTLDIKTLQSDGVPGSQGMWCPRWSPNGRYIIATVNWSDKVMIYDVTTKVWQEFVKGGLGWASWSRDSEFVYGVDGDSFVRVAVSNHKKELVAPLVGFNAITFLGDRFGWGWYGITPDGRLLSTRNTSVQEIYALDLKYE